MGVNKVGLSNGETIIDLTSDSVSPETLAEGETAHNSQGERIMGTMSRGGDMFKSTYDTDDNGKVDKADDSDKLGGQLSSYYAKASDIPTVPTKVSAFQNDAGYLTQHQDLSAYAKKTDIPTVPTKLSQLSNDKTFMTKAEIEALIEEIVLKGYLGNYRLRVANDSGKTGYITVKKG